jgi:hypothetical protein
MASTIEKYLIPISSELYYQAVDHLSDLNLRLSSGDLKRLGKTSIELADGSGNHMGTIDAYHQLHCLQYIRQAVHADYYAFPRPKLGPVAHVG